MWVRERLFRVPSTGLLKQTCEIVDFLNSRAETAEGALASAHECTQRLEQHLATHVLEKEDALKVMGETS